MKINKIKKLSIQIHWEDIAMCNMKRSIEM